MYLQMYITKIVLDNIIQFSNYNDNNWFIFRPKKNICVFTVTCQKNLGSVGRDSIFLFFFLLSTKPEIVVPGSGIRFRFLIFEN